MANLRDIRRRIKSVKSTSQITKAMQLVAAAKMKKAQEQALAGREYADQLNKVLISLEASVDNSVHPLLEEREGGKTLMLVISTDKGLCGGLNTNLLKKIREESDENTHFVTVGRKLRLSLVKSGETHIADFPISDPLPFSEARPIAKFLTDKFLSGEYNRIQVAFTKFGSTLRQDPWVSQLLTIEPDTLAEKRAHESYGKETDKEAALAHDYIFEPSPEAVFNRLLPLYINFQVYQMLVESLASEHSSRMVAMKSATDNAQQMVKDLTLEYNKARQAAITSELLEITTAQKAME